MQHPYTLLGYRKDINGITLIIELEGYNKIDKFAFIAPPHYKVGELIGKEYVASAFFKHEFIPLPKKQIIHGQQQLIDYIRQLQ